MIKTGNLRVVFGDGEDSLIGDGKGEAIEMRIHKVPGPKRVGGVSMGFLVEVLEEFDRLDGLIIASIVFAVLFFFFWGGEAILTLAVGQF